MNLGIAGMPPLPAPASTDHSRSSTATLNSSVLSGPPPSELSSSPSCFSRTPSLLSEPAASPPLQPTKSGSEEPSILQRYPSPWSSSTSRMQTPEPPLSQATSLDSAHTDRPYGQCTPSLDGPSLPKQRRVVAPKERKTEHIDLQEALDKGDVAENRLMHRLRSAIRHKRKIIVVAGAGISVAAGVPDFRSSKGLFKTSGKHLFDASVYRHNSSTESFHAMVRELAELARNARPTYFHHMLASLAHEGRLMRLYTQNVDCIDTALEPLATTIPLNLKGPWPKTIQLHGGLAKMVCSKCNQLMDFDPTLFSGPEAPPCPECETVEMLRSQESMRGRGVGRLRPRMVLYNEWNPDADAIGNVSEADLKKGADAVIVVGTSLKIPGVRRLVKELCLKTRSRRDGFTAWINVDAEPQGVEFKDCFDLIIRGSADDVACVAQLPLWDAQDNDHSAVLSDDDSKSRAERLGRDMIEVQIPVSSSLLKPYSIRPPPCASPKPRPKKHMPKLKQGTLLFQATAHKYRDEKSTPKSKAPASKKLAATARTPTLLPAKRGQKNMAVTVNETVSNTFKATKNQTLAIISLTKPPKRKASDVHEPERLKPKKRQSLMDHLQATSSHLTPHV